jgi:hypothetical protein
MSAAFRLAAIQSAKKETGHPASSLPMKFPYTKCASSG